MQLSMEGKEYPIPNVGNLRLYPISKLSQMFVDADMPRSPITIRKWIYRGILPDTIFKNKEVRLFTMEQMRIIVNTAKECGVQNGINLESTQFKQVVQKRLNALFNSYLNR